MPRITEELSRLPHDFRARLDHFGFDPGRLLQWSARLSTGVAEQNRVKGTVTPPLAGDVVDLPDPMSSEAERLTQVGMDAIARGELALVVLAGGMATRMGGVVKALVPAVGDKTFLNLRLREHDHWSRISGSVVPLWLMTSHATDAPIRAALGPKLSGDEIAAFPQMVSLRLTHDGGLFLDENGGASVYATGHGDLPDALVRSGLLQRFVASGGRYVAIANLDNLGASIDPLLLGWHMRQGVPLSVEVVDKVGSDRGGIPVRNDGRPMILEEMRLPSGFDASQVRVFNTNTFLVDADVLSKLSFDWTYVIAEKKVDSRVAVQFERLIGEMTAALPTRFVRVPREGIRSRFLPVKDEAELDMRRGQIAQIASARGMVES